MSTTQLQWFARSGFTFIELLVTLSLLALLASVVLPMSDLMSRQEKEKELHRALLEIRQGLDDFKHASDAGKVPEALKSINGYPLQLTTLMGLPDGNQKKQSLRFLRRIPRDPFFPDPKAKAEDTWGKRSYQSDADNPAAGIDVYDVYSLSSQVGTNGVPYKEW